MRKAVKELAGDLESKKPPKRVWKPSGVNRRGERYEPYIQLQLWHHHLSRRSDPLLVMQKVGDDWYGVAISTHAEYFEADKMLWLQRHHIAIEWAGNEALQAQVAAYTLLIC